MTIDDVLKDVNRHVTKLERKYWRPSRRWYALAGVGGIALGLLAGLS